MPIKAVVFDIGGVLEQNPRTGWAATWEARLGLPAGALDARLGDIWAAGSLGQVTEAEVVRAMQTRLALTAAQLEALRADMWAEYVGTLDVAVADFFRGLRPRYRTAIISNSFVGAREREVALYQFDTICEFIVYSHEVGVAKPDPRIFALTWERLGVQPDEMLFLDDHAPHVAAAQALGIQGVVFHDAAQAISDVTTLLAASLA